MRRVLTAALACAGIGLSSAAQDTVPSDDPPPPSEAAAEVRRIVDVLAGSWSGAMTAAIPDAPPESFGWTMECEEIALGNGVACKMGGKPSIGHLAQACLVAFDPVGKAVHYMCVTSMGEVHDHDGQWTDERTIEFAPIAGSFLAEPAIETIRFRFPAPGAIEMRTILTLPDGATMRFEFKGRRS
jgi:hypothetical protein